LTQDLHSATSQKTTFFIVTAVKASNHTRVWISHIFLASYTCRPYQLPSSDHKCQTKMNYNNVIQCLSRVCIGYKYINTWRKICISFVMFRRMKITDFKTSVTQKFAVLIISNAIPYCNWRQISVQIKKALTNAQLNYCTDVMTGR
jgi:hypothetical protein